MLAVSVLAFSTDMNSNSLNNWRYFKVDTNVVLYMRESSNRSKKSRPTHPVFFHFGNFPTET